MGNGADFLARDAMGRQSEYTSLAPAVTINGVKGHLIKRNEDSDTHTNLPFMPILLMYISGRTRKACAKQEYMQVINCILTLTGVMHIQTREMVVISKLGQFMYKFGSNRKMVLSNDYMTMLVS